MTCRSYHVSHVASGSMLGPSATSYRRVEASSEADALSVAKTLLGHPEGGEWRVRLAEDTDTTVTYPRRQAVAA